MNTAKIFLARKNEKYLIKVKGRATFESGPPLRTFVNNINTEDLKEIFIDLGECVGMDSTFMGILAMIGLKSKNLGIDVVILNASENNTKLMSGLGIHKLFTFSKTSPETQQKFDWIVFPQGDHDKIETAETVLDAHETLIHVDDNNLKKFKDVVEFVKKDIQKEKNPPENQ